jgi:hypothetical protein
MVKDNPTDARCSRRIIIFVRVFPILLQFLTNLTTHQQHPYTHPPPALSPLSPQSPKTPLHKTRLQPRPRLPLQCHQSRPSNRKPLKPHPRTPNATFHVRGPSRLAFPLHGFP